MAVAVSNLPLPDDCQSIIKSYMYLDPTTYKSKLVKKSVHAIMRVAVTAYNRQLEGYSECKNTYIHRWYPMLKYQHQFCLCTKCGNYEEIEYGILPERCKCVCYIQ